jgi:HSP20 family protein
MADALTRWHPFADLADLRTRFDRLFDEMASGERRWAPTVDLVEEDDKLVLRADVPGIKPDDVNLEVEDEKGKRYVRRERRSGSFSRSISLPKGVKADDIEAECKDGVCEVTIPLPAGAKKKAVTIKPKAA